MTLKQLWCRIRYKHPSRQYATVQQLEKAYKDRASIPAEMCRKCGKVLKAYHLK